MSIWLLGFVLISGCIGLALMRATTPVRALPPDDPPTLLPRSTWEQTGLLRLRAHPDGTLLLLDGPCAPGSRDLAAVLDHVLHHLPGAVLGRLDETRIGVITPHPVHDTDIEALRSGLARCHPSGGIAVTTCQPGRVGSVLAAITEADRHHRRTQSLNDLLSKSERGTLRHA